MKNIDKKKVGIVVITVILTFSVLLISGNLFDSYKNQKPLEAYLNNNENVEDFEFDKKNRILVITINPEKSFKNSVEEIEKNVLEFVSDLSIKYKDNPSDKLLDIYSQYHLDFYEHIIFGSFGFLNNLSKLINENESIISRFETDGNRVFITFIDGNHYMFKIIDFSQIIRKRV